MICRLCLNNIEKGLSIFGDDGNKQQVSFIIGKHFWFEPKPNDALSQTVCWKCWKNIENFNVFYNQIKEAHKLLFQNPKEITLNIKNNKHFVLEDAANKLKVEKLNLNTTFHAFPPKEDFVNVHSSDYDQAIERTDLFIKNNEDKSKGISEEKISLNFLMPYKPEIGITENKANLLSNLDKKKNTPVHLNNIKLISTIRKITKGKRNRKTPEEVAALNKKLANEDKIIDMFMKVSCNVCTLEQKNFSTLKKHCTVEHKQKGFVICCDKKYFKRFLLVDHIEKHLNPESYKCSFCEKIFTSRWTLKDHIQFIHKNVENNVFFKCSHCEKSFTNKNLKLRHELFHIPEEERKFKCKSCEKPFPSKATLNCHIRIEHEKRYAGICDICGKSYKNKADLKRHRWEQHEGDDKPKIQCKFCDLQFLSRYTYQLHKNNDHKNQNVEQKCATCEKKFPNTEALKSHIRYTHNAKPKFQCNICEKYFKRQLVLKEHMAVHTGQPLYACPHCPKTFTHSSNMHHHRKRVHPKEFEEARLLHHVKKESWCCKTALKN